jgi:hypothetical protein
MTTKKIPLDKASDNQLCTFALTRLGFERVTPQMGRAAILQKIAHSWDKDYIEEEVKESAMERRDPPAKKGTGKGPFAGRRCVTMRIHPNEMPGGDQPVPAACNGVQIFLPRDQEIRIPYEYMEAIDHAKRFVYSQGPNGELIYPPREVHDYPFSILAVDPEFPGWNMTEEERRAAKLEDGGFEVGA